MFDCAIADNNTLISDSHVHCNTDRYISDSTCALLIVVCALLIITRTLLIVTYFVDSNT